MIVVLMIEYLLISVLKIIFFNYYYRTYFNNLIREMLKCEKNRGDEI